MKVFGHSGIFIPSCQLSPGESTTGRHKKAHDKKLVAFNPDRACEAKNRFHSVFVNRSKITFMFINYPHYKISNFVLKNREGR